MTEIYASPQSLALRAKLSAQAFSLRRVISRTPFFRLPAHRIPTLWTLYRGLLRNSPTEHVQFRVRALFRAGKRLTGPKEVTRRLERAHKWLEFFQKASNGDVSRQAILMRYSRLIAAKRDKADMNRIVRAELESKLRERSKPIWTGGFLRPTLYHGPLPRMRPQPQNISPMIRKRIFVREAWQDLRADLGEWLKDLVVERDFEEGLAKMTRAGPPFLERATYAGQDAINEWIVPIKAALDEIFLKEEKGYARAATPYSPDLVAAIIEARREKIRNKTRERERTRRGELTRTALRDMQRGPPAHILARMTPQQKEMDRISRLGSEVGYVAMVKKKLGHKLKHDHSHLEDGREENKELLDAASKRIRARNLAREKGFGQNLVAAKQQK